MPRARPATTSPAVAWAELLSRLAAARPAERKPPGPGRREQDERQRTAAYRLNEALRDHSRG